MINGSGKTAKIDLRFLIREPGDVYHAKSKDFLTAHDGSRPFFLPERVAIASTSTGTASASRAASGLVVAARAESVSAM